ISLTRAALDSHAMEIGERPTAFTTSKTTSSNNCEQNTIWRLHKRRSLKPACPSCLPSGLRLGADYFWQSEIDSNHQAEFARRHRPHDSGGGVAARRTSPCSDQLGDQSGIRATAPRQFRYQPRSHLSPSRISRSRCDTQFDPVVEGDQTPAARSRARFPGPLA